MIYKKYSTPNEKDPIKIINGDIREIIKSIPDDTIQCVVTSPPYWGVRDYGVDNQIGAEADLSDYINHLVEVFSEVKRILKPEGTFWLNIGNTYTSGGRKWRQEDSKNKGRGMSYRPDTPKGLKKKDLIGIAWLIALECQKKGWYLRNDIIWHKPNCQPESVKDRLTVSHEYIFLLTKSDKYYFNQTAILEETKDGKSKKNKRTVWSVNTEPYKGAHFATFPPTLIRPCILAGSQVGDIVFDPFLGAGTVCLEACHLGRLSVGVELNPDYANLAQMRTNSIQKTLSNL
jgi:DNA modification methylase